MDKSRIRNIIGGTRVDDTRDSDNIAIALCTYLSDHPFRPEDDPEGEHGWGEWVEQKCDEVLDRIVVQLMEEFKK